MKLVTDAIVVSLIVGGRYFVVSGGFYFYFYRWRRAAWASRRIQPKFPSSRQMRREIGWSLGTTVFFGAFGAGLVWAFERGLTKVYLRADEFGWAYLPISLFLLLAVHDAYFYVVHRLMHHRVLFRWFHKVHHESRHPSPFASFSFHPLESFLESVVVPALVFVIPVHWSVFLIFLMVMTVSGVVNHLGFEVFPRGANRSRLMKWLINPTHHELHHLKVYGNYGLYFTWWDRLLSTQLPEYDQWYERITG